LHELAELAEWAWVNRVHPQRAYRWSRQDRMPVPARRLASGTIWVGTVPCHEAGGAVLYTWVYIRAVTAVKEPVGVPVA